MLIEEPRRVNVMVGKLGALFCAVFGQVIVGFGVAAGASVVVALSQGQQIAAPSGSDLFGGLVAGWLILTAWAALGAVLALLLRGTAVPIGIGFAFLLINQLIASLADRSGVLADVARGMLGTDAGALARSIMPGSAGAAAGLNSLLTGSAAAAVLGAYVLVATGLSCAVLARRDVN